MKVEVIERVFNYNGVSLADPGAGMSPEAVRDFYSAMYPEINSASVEGPEDRGGKLQYTFRRAVGTKA
jgi:PRTRC genetic system protein C